MFACIVKTLIYRPRLISIRYESSYRNGHSFTVSYLINSCGFSPECALSASRIVNFETPDKPDSVIRCFKNHGFSKTQVSKIIRKRPTLLLSNPEETLLPRVEFFLSKGMSSSEFAKIVSTYPSLLNRSLENLIVPCYNFFKGLTSSDEKTITAIKRCSPILSCDFKTYFEPKIKILLDNGVPRSKIGILLERHPRVFAVSFDRFEETVEEVKRMDLNPLTLKFLLAVTAKLSMSKPKWERKLNIFKHWGWSENEFLLAFKKHPHCIMHSEDKIMAAMDFYVNKMGLESSVCVKYPLLISLSLEKRVIPRCLVYQTLLSKGLIKKDCSLSALLKSTEKSFLKKFVTCYEKEAAQLLTLYEEKMSLSK